MQVIVHITVDRPRLSVRISVDRHKAACTLIALHAPPIDAIPLHADSEAQRVARHCLRAIIDYKEKNQGAEQWTTISKLDQNLRVFLSVLLYVEYFFFSLYLRCVSRADFFLFGRISSIIPEMFRGRDVYVCVCVFGDNRLGFKKVKKEKKKQMSWYDFWLNLEEEKKQTIIILFVKVIENCGSWLDQVYVQIFHLYKSIVILEFPYFNIPPILANRENLFYGDVCTLYMDHKIIRIELYRFELQIRNLFGRSRGKTNWCNSVAK